MSAVKGEHSSGQAPQDSSCHRRTHTSTDVTGGHVIPTHSTVTPKKESSGRSKIAECTLTVQEEAREAGECGEGEPCSPKDQDLNVVWPTETEASRITEHKDDPEEESTQYEEETSEKLWNTFQQQFGKLCDAEG